MYEKECIPFAPSLIESMRSLGYSFPVAIADLIDNSISARAKNINIISEPSTNPTLIILDDGHGMSRDEIYEAMRYGSQNPKDKRGENDLGRFGLGLKSASLSQCRKLVVISKKDGQINGFSWDLNYVEAKQSWLLKGYSTNEILKQDHIDKLINLEQGTYIELSDFDRIKTSEKDISLGFASNIVDMREHLSLVFHRFLEEEVVVTVNGEEVKAKDPFLTHHKATQKRRESSFVVEGEKIIVKPYILPHLSKLSRDDLDKVGGKDRLRNDQGFYIYRNKRLIIWGTWFRLERKNELNKLARVMVDIPNTLDYMWKIDIKKSTATLPRRIKDNMYNAINETVFRSESVHTFRGRKEKKDKNIDYVWERLKIRDGYKYQINRDIPQLKLLEDTLDNQQRKILISAIKLLEDTFPTAALYVDFAKGEIDDNKDDNVESMLWEELQNNMSYVKDNNLSIRDYYNMFMKLKPYCEYDSIKKKIREELDKYE